MDKLNLMRSFVTVVEEGSFTAAAKRLGKTKALLSIQVTQLEERLKVSLLRRSTRSLTTTQAGQAYWLEAKRILDDVENLESQLLNKNSKLAGEIRISTPITFGEEVLTPFISALIIKYPALHIDMMLSDRHVDIVTEGYDLAIRVGHLKDSSLIARKLADSRVVVCATPTLIQKYGCPIDPTQLSQLPCIVDSNYLNGVQWHFNHGGTMLEVGVRGVVTVNNARAATALALAHTGIAAIPDFIATKYLQSGELIEVLNEFDMGLLPIHALYSSRKHLSVKISHFMAELSHYFDSQSA